MLVTLLSKEWSSHSPYQKRIYPFAHSTLTSFRRKPSRIDLFALPKKKSPGDPVFKTHCFVSILPPAPQFRRIPECQDEKDHGGVLADTNESFWKKNRSPRTINATRCENCSYLFFFKKGLLSWFITKRLPSRNSRFHSPLLREILPKSGGRCQWGRQFTQVYDHTPQQVERVCNHMVD